MITYVLIGLAVLAVFYVANLYNRLVRLRNEAEESFKSIDIYLKQRYDLIPNLVNTIKGYTAYESSTLEKVISLRQQAMAYKETLHRVANASVVGGHQHPIDSRRPRRALVDALDHRLPLDVGEWLSGETGGLVACGDDGDNA